MANNNSFGFRGDNPEFLKRVAQKYNLSPEGIKQITYLPDLVQIEKRIASTLKENYPGAAIAWDNTRRRTICEAFMNADAEIFGFVKIKMPSKDGNPSYIVPSPFHLQNPLNKIEKLF